MQVLNFDEPFAPAYGIIHMQPNTYVFYRGYINTYPAVSNRPAYYGTLKNASSYSSGSDRTISAFTNTKSLRLLDIRFMKDILREVFSTDQTNVEIFSVMLSFGISSLYNQCLLAKQRLGTNNDSVKALAKTYKEGLYEQQGVRIAETINDAYTMAFLQKMFYGIVDGFVSPVQESAYHITQGGKIPAEMIIFNPGESGIEVLPESAHIPYVVTMDYLYGRNFTKKIHIYKLNLYMKGGNRTEVPSVEKIAEEFNTNPTIRKEWYGGAAAGERWKKRIDFTVLDKTLVHVSPWRNKTRRRRDKIRTNRMYVGGSNPVPSVERIGEEFDTNPIIREEWEKGSAAAERYISRVPTQSQKSGIIQFDPPIRLREYEQMVQTEIRAENASNTSRQIHVEPPTIKLNPWTIN